jgi:hypothetical protein
MLFASLLAIALAVGGYKLAQRARGERAAAIDDFAQMRL